MVHLKSVLAANLKTRRKSLNLTQEKLAELVNTAPTYIAMIEAGHRTPSFTMIERLAQALQIEAVSLFSINNDSTEPVSAIHENLMSEFDKFLRSAAKQVTQK